MKDTSKRRVKGEYNNDNFSMRITGDDFDKIKRLSELTGRPIRKAVMYAVNQYLGEYEINNERRTF